MSLCQYFGNVLGIIAFLTVLSSLINVFHADTPNNDEVTEAKRWESWPNLSHPKKVLKMQFFHGSHHLRPSRNGFPSMLGYRLSLYEVKTFAPRRGNKTFPSPGLIAAQKGQWWHCLTWHTVVYPYHRFKSTIMSMVKVQWNLTIIRAKSKWKWTEPLYIAWMKPCTKLSHFALLHLFQNIGSRTMHQVQCLLKVCCCAAYVFCTAHGWGQIYPQ